MKKNYILTFIFCTTSLLAITEKKVATFIAPRSQSVNAARELVGWERHVNIYNNDKPYGSFAIIPEVTRSFRPERIAQCLFGDDIVKCKNTFHIVGSRVKGRNDQDHWLADYFGLPTDFESKVRVNPEIMNFLIDFDVFLGLDRVIPGLYIRAHAPVVYTRWDLKLTETIVSTGTNNYDPGYFNGDGVQRDDLLDCFTSFVSGLNKPNIKNSTFEKLNAAKMSKNVLHSTKFAEIQLALGYNILNTKKGHFGINVRGSIPAGTRPKGEYLFEPVVGNGHHGEIGIGLSGHARLWQQEATAEQVLFHAVINIMRPFNTTQCRSFDLKCKPNSRYMLAAKMKQSIENNLQGNGKQPDLQFDSIFAPVANITTFKVNVRPPAEVDAAGMFSYIKDDFSFNFGYSFWARSCEHITVHKCTPLDGQDKWVLKGDAHMFGFMGADDAPLNVGDPIALSASQNQADVHTGKNFPENLDNFDEGKKNPNIDNPQAATAGVSDTRLLFEPDAADNDANQINTSIQPIVISRKDLDFHSARTRGISHKIFGQFTKSWIERKILIPYIGLGAEVEFGRRPGPTPPKEKAKCINSALSHWGVWAKTGFSYR